MRRAARSSGVATVALIAAYVALLGATALWTTYVHPTRQGIVQRVEYLRGEGGRVAAVFARIGDADSLEAAAWYRDARDRLDDAELAAIWGPDDARAGRSVFGDAPIDPHARYGALLGRALGSYEDALYASMFLLPLLVAAKYAYLWMVLPPGRRTSLLVASALADMGLLGDLNVWLGPRAYAWHLFSAGAVTLLGARAVPVGIALCVVAALVDPAHGFALAAVAGAAALGTTSHRARSVASALDDRWPFALGIAVAATLGISAIAYLIVAAIGDPGASLYGRLEPFQAHLSAAQALLSPSIVILAIVGTFAGGSARFDSSVRLLSVALPLLVAALAASVILAPLLAGVALTGVSHDVQSLLVLRTVLLMWPVLAEQGPRALSPARWRPAVLAVLVPVAVGAGTFGHALPIRQAVRLVEYEVPKRIELDGCSYYLAWNPQQAFTYFARRSYESAPLLIDADLGRYRRDEARAAICAVPAR